MPTHGLRTRIAPLALATALVGGLAVTTTATAPAAHAAGSSYYLYFKKNMSNPINSKLYLMKSVANAKDKVVAKYRAGSGNGSRDECAVSRGWLPGTTTKNGKYDIEFHRTDFDGIINGYVIKLSDKKCSKGTKRTELFVHSEMQPNGKQGTIESERWDGTGDYYSNGCVKLKPADIKDLFAKAKRYGWPKTLYVVK
ncbi:L,D-transpeptidase family protein [Streptomyces fungicidicus]|uniref:L,D-transpeptidase family protein n=1 Tax=Streptomyces fungicidicus TaxID=68203 RepID=UPI00365FA624